MKAFVLLCFHLAMSGSQLSYPILISIWAPLSGHVECMIPNSSIFSNCLWELHCVRWLLGLRCRSKCNRKGLIWDFICYCNHRYKLKTFKRWILVSLVIDRLSLWIDFTVLAPWTFYDKQHERNVGFQISALVSYFKQSSQQGNVNVCVAMLVFVHLGLNPDFV